MIKKIIAAILITFLALLQISFFSALAFPYFNINLILALVIFWAVLRDYKKSLLIGLFLSLILELYSPFPFGLIIFSLLLTLIFINSLFVHFFTNRSLFSLFSLTLVGVLAYNFILLIISNIIHFFISSADRIILNQVFWVNLIWQMVFILSLVIILFASFSIFERFKIKPRTLA